MVESIYKWLSPYVTTGLHTEDPGWYNSLTSSLDKDQQKEVQDVLTMADQRKAVEGKHCLI